MAKKKTKPKRKEVPSSLISSHPGTTGFGRGSPARSPNRNLSRPGPSKRSPPGSLVGSMSESSDSSHAKKKRKKTYKLHQCATCGKTWKEKSDLDSHMVTEHGQGWHCAEHSKYFKHKKGYKQHIKYS